jgi:hypothetical protein
MKRREFIASLGGAAALSVHWRRPAPARFEEDEAGKIVARA